VGCAHSGQNFAVADSWRPHLVHARASGAAHSSQNFAPGSLSCPHRGQLIGVTLTWRLCAWLDPAAKVRQDMAALYTGALHI
jgi:hypothetical protein